MSDKSQHFHVTDREAGQTLSAAMRRWLGQISWNDVRAFILCQHVQVNGNLCLDEARRLKVGEVVKVYEHPLAAPASETDVKLRYVDEHLVVVEKPAGMTSERHIEEKNWPTRRKQLQPTLDELLPRIVAKHLGWKVPREEAPKSRADRRQNTQRINLPRLFAVHRLDRDTSGLMVFARTPECSAELVKLFKKHHVQRAYVAVVHGHPEEQKIETWLVRDRGDGLRGSAKEGKEAPESQKAVTHVRPLQKLGPYSVVECRLETGRTHQIRIHMSELGFMICGEKMYTHAPGKRVKRDESGAPRQALHAAELGFVHPMSKEPLIWRMNLPRELADWIRSLQAE